MSGYFNLELRPDQRPIKERHILNRPYKGSRPFEMRAPDAAGLIVIHARSLDEANDHAINAMFDLIFRSATAATAVHNPRCPFCNGRTQRHGRNSSGTRTWKCQAPGCQRYFVLDRVWRGGKGHAAQSKKPEFARLVLMGVPTMEAADRIGVNHDTAGRWAEQVAANNPEVMARLECPCGKNIRHRGSCEWRNRKHLRLARLARGAA
jgi:transposase-like protein